MRAKTKRRARSHVGKGVAEQDVLELGVARLSADLGREVGRMVARLARGPAQTRSVPSQIEELGLVLTVTGSEGKRGKLPLLAVRALANVLQVIHSFASDAERPLLADATNILNAVQAAVLAGDRSALAGPAKWARDEARKRPALATRLGNMEAVPSSNQLAAAILRALDTEVHSSRARSMTRWEVAQLLATLLRRQFPSQPFDELCSAVYEHMPLNGNAWFPDRVETRKSERFNEDLEKTIIAAFKAAGHPKTHADGLFGAQSKAVKRAAMDKSELSKEPGAPLGPRSNFRADGKAAARASADPEGSGTT